MKARPLYLLSSCFFLSGLAGLIYETAWTQQLSLVFGTSEEALVAVLAAYMGGLALGAALAGRWIRRVRRPIFLYGLLELGIALGALAVPVAITVTGHLHAAWLGSPDLPPDAASVGSTVFYLASSFAILLIPTALMGATLPLLARHAVRREAEIGPRIAVLYAANTAGAAAGTLTTAFVLLPRLGLGQTIGVAVGVNFLVFLLAVLLARGQAPQAEPSTAATSRPRRRASGAFWILPAIFISGAVSFSWEILWTRLLTPLLGGSIYAFATMLASFLVALALGSALAAPLAASPERARQGFVAAQIAIAGLSLAAFAVVDKLPPLVRQWTTATSSAALAAVILPGALAVGATFPFAVRILARRAGDTAAASARVFAWNTLGAIVGSLITGYFVLPELRFTGTATAATVVSLLLAMFAALVVRPRLPAWGAVALVAILALAMGRPATPWAVLRHSPLGARPIPGTVEHLAVGRSATVLLAEHHGEWRLSSNGLPESSIPSPAHRPARHIIAHWLALLPLAARPDTRSLLVVGLGAGVTLEEVPATVETLHVVELEPEVVRANQRLGAERRRDPLADPRLRLYINDARGALRLTEQRFDAIVSQPSHPWTAASHLYTRELFALVRDRLSPGGVFVQWMALSFVDETLLRSLVATAVDVFPHVELYQPHPGSVLVLGSDRPLVSASTVERALASGRQEWALAGVLCREDVLAARVLDNASARRFADGARLNTDARNLFRMRSPRVLESPLGAVGAARLLAPFAPLPGASEDLDRRYLVRRLIRQKALARARRLAETLEDPAARLAARGSVQVAAGRRRPGARTLQQALLLDDDEALAALLTLYRPTLVNGGAVALTQKGPAEYQAVVEGWRRSAAGDWRGIRRLEDRLTGLDPRHPFFAAALRLRVHWRAESGDEALAREALDLLTPLLAPVPEPADLLLRARAGIAAGEPRIALAAVEEALLKIAQRPAGKRDLVRQARRILGSLPDDDTIDGWRQDLRRLAGGRS